MNKRAKIAIAGSMILVVLFVADLYYSKGLRLQAEDAYQQGHYLSAAALAHEASLLFPFDGDSGDILDRALAASRKQTADSVLADMADGEWPHLQETFSTFRQSVGESVSEARSAAEIEDLSEAICAVSVAEANQASLSGDTESMARYLAAVMQADCSSHASDLETLRSSLTTKLADMVKRRRYLDAYRILSKLISGMPPELSESPKWADIHKLSEKCIAAGGIKVPNRERLWDIFEDAGFIVLSLSSNENVPTFEMSFDTESSGTEYYAPEGTDFFSAMSYGVQLSNMTTTITGEIKAPDGSVIFKLSASSYAGAPNEVDSNSYSQRSITESAEKSARRKFEAALIHKLSRIVIWPLNVPAEPTGKYISAGGK